VNNTENKAYPHPYGSTVIPTSNGLHGPTPNAPKLPGSPSPIPGSLGVAGAPSFHVIGKTIEPKPNKIAAALDALIDAIADTIADKVVAKLATVPPTIEPGPEYDPLYKPYNNATVDDLAAKLPDPEPTDQVALANQMHTDLEQALRELDNVKILRFAPAPIVFLVTTKTGPVEAMECTAYAQPYGQGYTDGAKPNEYVLLCDGKRLSWERVRVGLNGEYCANLGYGSSFTLDQLIDLVNRDVRADLYGRVVYEEQLTDGSRA